MPPLGFPSRGFERSGLRGGRIQRSALLERASSFNASAWHCRKNARLTRRRAGLGWPAARLARSHGSPEILMAKIQITQADPDLSAALAAVAFLESEEAALVNLVRAQTLSGASDREIVAWLTDRIAHFDRLVRRLSATGAADGTPR